MAAKKISKNVRQWKERENGYETTESSAIIKMALANIKKKRTFVVLMQKGYQSGNTIVVGFDDKYLQIDKPVDWPGGTPLIRVAFKDETLVWNHFSVKVVSASKDTLKTTFPTELFRLQRRSHFRINIPTGSKASFKWKDFAYFDTAIVNISVGGIMLRCDGEYSIVDGGADNNISNIVLKVLSGPDALSKEVYVIAVNKGRIVRENYDSKNHCLKVGVKFSPTFNEEKEIMQYVRQTELEFLRKGLK